MQRFFAAERQHPRNSNVFLGFVVLHAAGVCLSWVCAQLAILFLVVSSPVASHALRFALLGLPLVTLLQFPIAWALYAKGKQDWALGLGLLALVYPAIALLAMLWLV